MFAGLRTSGYVFRERQQKLNNTMHSHGIYELLGDTGRIEDLAVHLTQVKDEITDEIKLQDLFW